MSIIVDGTGKGTRAAVDSDNRLKVNAIVEDVYVNAAEEGDAFNMNTLELTLTGTGPYTQNLLYVKNNENSDIEVVGWFIGEAGNRSGGNTTSPILFEMYGSPTGTPGGTEVPVLNRRIGDPRVFDFTCLSKPTNVTIPSGQAPLLYQYHYGGRAFGTVNFTIPSGASILLRANIECNDVSLYTGFTGYVRGE